MRPVITYANETWVLEEYVKQKLLITERKILKWTFEPTKERYSTWRSETDELNDLIKNNNVINHIKSQRPRKVF
jgi:hypothetical protein